MVLKTSIYKLDEKSEYAMIQNKEAVNNFKNEFPEIMEDVGLNRNLLENEKKIEQKLIK